MSKRTRRKLVNSMDRCVDEMLEGYVAVNTGVRRLQGHRVLIRSDIEQFVKSGKVAVLSGGGSGHEPAFAGYVGRGMLSACVAGSVFASPPPQEILPAIRAVAKYNKGGCLLSVANYTGDRLNFGLAFEKARQEGIKIETITVGEDCALTSHDKTAGRRGLVGYIVTNKIAGALAEQGRSLEQIVTICKSAVKRMGTIGLSLSACCVPGSGPTFGLEEDEMELGLGVHGEAGVRRMKVTSAEEAVRIMLDHMRNPSTSTHLDIQPGDKVAVFVNNLGGTTNLEMNIISRETIEYLETNGINVERAYCRDFLTSLEMHGISITVLHLDDTIKNCLDAPTDAPCWPRPLLPPGVKDRKTPPCLDLDYVEDVTLLQEDRSAAHLGKEESQKMYSAVKHACTALIGAESKLNSLDTEGGDGDTGSTLARGAKAALSQLGSPDNPGLTTSCPYSLAQSFATIAENHMGGASGALHSLLFTAAATCLKDDVTPESWSNALKQGILKIMKYGGAEPGDRTMLDALHAASFTFSSELRKMSAVEAFNLAVQAAERATQNTATMKAQAGRASYVHPDRLTQPDPGAVGVTVWMRAVLESLM